MVSDPTLFRVPATPETFLYFGMVGSTRTAPGASFFSSGGMAARSPHVKQARTSLAGERDLLREACMRASFPEAWAIRCSPWACHSDTHDVRSRQRFSDTMRRGQKMDIAPGH